MGALRDGHDLARRVQAAAQGVPKAAAAGVAKAAALMEASVVIAAGPYAGSPLVRTKTTFTPVPDPTALVRMVSRKAHLLDHDTRPHDIGPRTAQVLVIGGQPVAGVVHHPGTKGKLIWEKAVVAARVKMAAAVADQVGRGLVKALQ